MKRKLFTKSAFKIALECPRRLYYAYDSKLYANQQLQDDFLQSLARGGFQVGELAKVYYGIKGDFVEKMSKLYCDSIKADMQLGSKCFGCPFHKTEKDDAGLLDGYRECWKDKESCGTTYPHGQVHCRRQVFHA